MANKTLKQRKQWEDARACRAAHSPDQNETQAARRLRRSGETLERISQDLGFSISTIFHAVSDLPAAKKWKENP